MLRGLVSAALVLFVTSALPLRPPARILSSCQKPWKGCPEEEEGGSRLGEKLTGFSEAMAMYEDKSGSASAWTGENGLDRAASKGLATSAAATTARRQLYKNHGVDGSKTESGSTRARAGENGLDRAASKGLATSAAATTARRQLYKNHGADGSKTESGSTRARAGENGLDRAASKVFATSVAATSARLQLYKNHGADGSKSDESASASARAGENGLDRAASKVFATSVAATMARRQLHKNYGADGSKSDESGSTFARAGENGLDRAASKGLATSVAARNTWLQLYKNYGADGLYADAFDSETTKGAAKAELDLNKYQAGGVHALHAIEQVSYVQSETMVYVQGTIKHAVTAESACTGKPTYSCVSSFEQAAEGCSSEIVGGCPLAGVDVLDVASAEPPLVPGTTLMLAAWNATKWDFGEEEWAQSNLVWGLFKFLAILVKIFFAFGWISVYVVFMFGWVVPRLSSLAKGAAWSSSVVGYLLFWPEIALVAAATATSVRGSDYTITKSSKIKTNESPSSPVQSREQRRVLSGYVMTDSNIRTAVAAWFSDPSAAESTYGHISTWDTGGVTDMSELFCAESSDCSSFYNSVAEYFNEDIGAWDTSGVTTTSRMFQSASSFNQDLGDWSVDNVMDMRYMFVTASDFDQDLGWCVDDDVSLDSAFYATECASTSCGVYYSAALRCGGGPMGDSSIKTAVAEWLSDATAAEAKYGHISTWDTGGVTDMKELFCAEEHSCDYSNSAADNFNEDIGAWDTSGVTDMSLMFHVASSFNQDLGGWSVDNVMDMRYMFVSASAFDQDLGWCVDDDVSLDVGAFYDTECESTSCGVLQGVCDYPMTDSNIKTAVAAWLADASAAETTYGHISTWDTSGVTDMSELFKDASSFNEDIGAWDTSGVTTMYALFYGAEAFNQDIGDWAVNSVMNIGGLFWATAFNQDLSGWCMDSSVNVVGPESMHTRTLWGSAACSRPASDGGTPIIDESCGVRFVDGACAPTPRPTDVFANSPPELGADVAAVRLADGVLVAVVIADVHAD